MPIGSRSDFPTPEPERDASSDAKPGAAGAGTHGNEPATLEEIAPIEGDPTDPGEPVPEVVRKRG